MKPYVTSLRASARLAHIGYPLTACGQVFIGPHRTSDHMPTDRTICRACVRAATGYGWVTRDEAASLLGRTRVDPERPIVRQVVGLLIDGHGDREVAQRLGVSMRTVSRYVAEAMRAAGARTRFQWGFRVGLAGG